MRGLFLGYGPPLAAPLERRRLKTRAGAYRSHTYKIQSELRELRRRVAEEQSSQQKDEKVGHFS
jgi:hypothetical protein